MLSSTILEIYNTHWAVVLLTLTVSHFQLQTGGKDGEDDSRRTSGCFQHLCG